VNAHLASSTGSGRREGVKYRAAVTKPGEALILPQSPIDELLRASDFIAELGLHRTEVVDSRLVALPIPRYTEQPEGEGRGARWSSVKPEWLWHPFFWLPERLASRYATTGDDGQRVVESDDQWALRVMWEMTASGLYDSESGEWVDVLSLAGLNIDDGATAMRITEWQLGIDDPDLDNLSLDALLRVEDDPDWAIVAAGSIEDPVRRTVWARAANTLLDWCYRTEADYEDNHDVQRLRRQISSILRTGQTFLTGITSDGFGSHNAEGIDPFWADQISVLDSTREDELPSLLMDEISVHCGDIRDGHWEATERFWEDYAADTPVGDQTANITRVDDGEDW